MARQVNAPAPGGGVAPVSQANEGADARLDVFGLTAAAGAYFIWGLLPVYLKLVGHVPVIEVLINRALWSIGFVGLPLLVFGKLGAALSVFVRPKLLGLLAVTAGLMSANWLVYIWAVDAGRVLDASLAYFIGPLVSIVIGRFVLGEPLTRAQWLAVAIAAIGVSIKGVGAGGVPLLSLFLALSFVFYGLLRRRTPVAAGQGLFVETVLMAPVMIAIGLQVAPDGGALFNGELGTQALLVAAGLVTASPLVLYAIGAQRLRFSTLGILQFIGPSLQFLVAIAYGEQLTRTGLTSFAFIWFALAIYLVDGAVREGRARRRRRVAT